MYAWMTERSIKLFVVLWLKKRYTNPGSLPRVWYHYDLLFLMCYVNFMTKKGCSLATKFDFCHCVVKLQNIFLNIMKIIKMFFFGRGKVRWKVGIFFLEISPMCYFSLVSGLPALTDAGRAFNAFDVVLGSVVTSSWCAVGVMLVDWQLLRRFTTYG